jgi:hypothetical protein
MLEIRNAHGTQCYVRLDEFDQRAAYDHDPFDADARPAKRGRKPAVGTAVATSAATAVATSAARTLAAKPRPQLDAGEDW